MKSELRPTNLRRNLANSRFAILAIISLNAGCSSIAPRHKHVEQHRRTTQTAESTIPVDQSPQQTDFALQGTANNSTTNNAPDSVTLEEILSLAFENNPAIKELAATTRIADGYRLQVGLYANPILGY